MRPLRAMRRFPGIRIIVEAMISSVPDVANVLAVCAIFFMIFAIFCVNFLKGQFRACQGPDFDDVISGSPIEKLLQAPKEWHKLLPEEKGWFGPGSNVTGGSWGAAGADGGGGCLAGADWPSAPCCPQWNPVWLDARAPTSKEMCECWQQGGADLEWAPTLPMLFDDMPTAMLTLFEISTTEGWTDVMFEAIDAAGIDMQPIRNNSALGWIVFFMFFMLFGGFFVVNLFVGVLLANFEQKRQQVQTDPHVKEDKAEAEWVTFADAICAAPRASRRTAADGRA